jgi:uncharacterized protein (DUF1697 family)
MSGGKNIIRMPDLRRVFEQLGCKDVTTYIQSGNVLFESKLKKMGMLSVSIERVRGHLPGGRPYS